MAKNNNSDFIDIAGLLRQYLSKWYLFVICTVLCTGVAYFYTKIRPEVYQVKANLLISPEKDAAADASAVMGGALSSLFGSEGYVEDEIFIVSSHSLYRNVARELGLNITYTEKKGFMQSENPFPKSPVVVIPAAGITDTLEHSIAFKIKVLKDGKADIEASISKNLVAKVEKATLPYVVSTPLGQYTIATTKYYKPGEDIKVFSTVKSYDAAAEQLDNDVMTEIASKRSNVLTMSINTSNTVYGKAILNQIISEYNRRGIAERNNQNELTAQFIDGRLLLLADELATAENAIQKYKEDKGIVDIEFQSKYQADKKSRIEEELLRAQTQEEITQLTLNFLRDPRNTYSLIPTTLDNEGIQRNIDAYNNAIMERMQITNSARGENTALRQISDKIDVMRSNITASVVRALEASQVSVKDLRNEMAEASQQLENIPLQEKEFRNILRQQEVKQSLFIFLLQRREETAMMLANNFPKGVVIDEAYTMSEPLGMKKKMILAMGFLFGFILTPIGMYVRKMFNNRIESRRDIEKSTEVPIIGEICNDNSGHSLVALADNNTRTAELFRLVRSNLLFVLNDPRDKVVLTTSAAEGEGKTFVSINLAASLATLGKRVMLVGMDIRNPRIADDLGISPAVGLTQYLSSTTVTIPQLITPIADVPGLDVIVAGPVPPNPSELLVSPKVDELFTQLRATYDYIIVDTAPIGKVSDTYSLDRLADASIFICRVGKTSLQDINTVNDIAEQHRLKKISIVVNDVYLGKEKKYGNY